MKKTTSICSTEATPADKSRFLLRQGLKLVADKPKLLALYTAYIVEAQTKLGLPLIEAVGRLPDVLHISDSYEETIGSLNKSMTKSALIEAFADGLPEDCIESPVRPRTGGYSNHRQVYISFFDAERLSGLEADHLCGNKACINTLHIVRSTTRENNIRRITNGNTHKTHCKRGHAYTATNTYQRNGTRQCHQCRRLNDRARQQRRRNGTTSVPFGHRIQCKHGHSYTPANTYVSPKTGHRACRICRRRLQAEHVSRRSA